ncbi:rhomboid family intramembrane serine protease [Bergeyella sp. RCAD1439]|uniref:rhomboid family intramembrane serine protease n=1 Tax=Bergeyella anatis TaxID=3113737 RepID=UPI002E19A19D|nr:rhomboid family intramembrane serine protease [Bergeyella sp. RCAD1439]
MFRNLTPITKNIILLNVLVYLAANFLMNGYLYQILSAYYPFSPNFHSWQILTHMFMHAPLGSGSGVTHILFNMFTLWSFGPVLEQTLGDRKFLVLYFASGLGAFLLFNLWNIYEVTTLTNQLQAMGVEVSEIFRKSDYGYRGDLSISLESKEGVALSQALFNALRTPMLGASGAIFGVVAAFSTLFPNAKLMFLFVPFPVKAKYILPFIIAVSLYLGFSGQMSGIAHFAHIGGALVGFLLALYWKRNRFRYR